MDGERRRGGRGRGREGREDCEDREDREDRGMEWSGGCGVCAGGRRHPRKHVPTRHAWGSTTRMSNTAVVMGDGCLANSGGGGRVVVVRRGRSSVRGEELVVGRVGDVARAYMCLELGAECLVLSDWC